MKLPEGIPLWETNYHQGDAIRSTLSADDCRTSVELNACLTAIDKGAKFHSAKAEYDGDGRCLIFYLRFITDDGEAVLRFRPDELFGCLTVSFLYMEPNEDGGYRYGTGGTSGVSVNELKGWDAAVSKT